MRLYIAVLEDVPDNMVPVLVSHAVLNAHLHLDDNPNSFARESYRVWLYNSFRKCVVRVNRAEFEKIRKLPYTWEQYESKTLDGEISCLVPVPLPDNELPNVLRFAKLWKPL